MKPIETQTDIELLASLRRADEALPGASPEAIARVLALWPARPPLAEAAAAGWRLVRAALGFDSWAGGPLAAGLRGGLPDATHQLVYTAEGRDIELRVEGLPSGYRVTGQLLGPDERGRVELVPAAGGEAAEVAIDDFGEFRFEPLPAGHYQLTVRASDLAIELPPLELGPRR